METNDLVGQQLISGKGYKLSIAKTLGKGAAGHVYLATQSATDTYYVVKTMLNIDHSQTQFPQGLSNQSWVLSLLGSYNHRNIVKCIDSGCLLVKPKYVPFLILEYCDEGSLFELIKKNQNILFERKTSYIMQIAAGILQLHQIDYCYAVLHACSFLACKIGVLHSDIKPENILLREGEVKICDYERARLVQKSQTYDVKVSKARGTKGYYPPEYYQIDNETAKRDVWAFGATIYYILKGVPLIQNLGNSGVMQSETNNLRVPEVLMKKWGDLHPLHQAMLRMTLEPNQTERCTMQEFIEKSQSLIMKYYPGQQLICDLESKLAHMRGLQMMANKLLKHLNKVQIVEKEENGVYNIVGALLRCEQCLIQRFRNTYSYIFEAAKSAQNNSQDSPSKKNQREKLQQYEQLLLKMDQQSKIMVEIAVKSQNDKGKNVCKWCEQYDVLRKNKGFGKSSGVYYMKIFNKFMEMIFKKDEQQRGSIESEVKRVCEKYYQQNKKQGQ